MDLDDILVAGGLAGLLGAAVRLLFTWATYLIGLQRFTLSHVYALLYVQEITPIGLVVGTLAFAFGWSAVGVILSQLFAWYGFKYWWIKGPGLAGVLWPYAYLSARRMYAGPPAAPSAANSLTSIFITLVAGFAAAAFLARTARWPGRAELLSGPAPARRDGAAAPAGEPGAAGKLDLS
jgi:hypothetical protein